MSDEKIFLTGASSGIGWALAVHWARPGTTLGLVARRAERLTTLQSSLRESGATVFTYARDVSDCEGMKDAADSFLADAGGITTVVANAGIGGPDRLAEGSAERAARIISVNVQGVIHTIAPFIPSLMAQKHGRIVTVGSVAGFRGMPGRAVYNASKAAVKTLMDGYRIALRRHGIRVTTICPGFVKTELTAKNTFAMPFVIEASEAARLIVKAVARGRKTYVFPWQWRLLLPLIVRVPDRF
ncbi:MAG: SDR family NAD(P)-dependent oxidoreductase, partial [Acidobacteria bacterium]|nr:SDR family NAD(P)-dependent oxidoreductase [Acidobacteriota bacterium]